MNGLMLSNKSLWIAAAALILALNPLLAAPKVPAAPPAEADPSIVKRVDFAFLPKSSFVVPTSPNQGRDPFFPNSSVVTKAPVAVTNAPVMDTIIFVLNGITGPPVRSAIINGRTFLQGEEGEVRLHSGVRVLIKCTEIFDERAIIEVAGTRRELRLRLGI